MDKRTAIIVLASTAIGFLGDTLIYSLGQSAGKKFSLHVPTGKSLFQLLALGIISGIAVDYSIRKIELALKQEEEKLLDQLVEKEKVKINTEVVKGKMPVAVLWT